ncbi:low temperature requirement protein A [Nesterenkonia suensis]
MASAASSVTVLRSSHPGTHGVGGMELFFDLVYVFTIIQLSHYLLYDLTWSGALETTVLFAAVWWGWNYTAWAMSWLDPRHLAVRVLLAVLMLAALIMAVAIPEAFTDRALVFALAYVGFQLLRSMFMVVAFRGTTMSRNYVQLLTWSALASVLWVAGAVGPEDLRLPLWVMAVLVDYSAPGLQFWLPGLGTARLSTWPVDEEHLAERSRLVFIVALGESILVLGGTLIDVDWTPLVVTAAVLGFCSIVLLWWLYFATRHGNVDHAAPDSAIASEVARGAYTYAHALMVAGAIVVAVSIELVVSRPWDTAGWEAALTLVGGPLLYLVGNALFVRSHTGRLSRSRVIASTVLIALLPVLVTLPTIIASALVLFVMLGLLVATGSVRQATSAGQPESMG